MLILLAVPVIIAVATLHRYLAAFAPTNVLTRQVRARRPRWTTVSTLAALTAALLLVVKAITGAVAGGAPRWLNLIVLVLAWDAIKIALLTTVELGRCTCSLSRRLLRRPRSIPRWC